MNIKAETKSTSLTLRRINAVVEDARAADFPEDPLLTTAISRLISTVSSVIKRHGPILEGAIADVLESCGRYTVLRRQRLPITRKARALARAGRRDEILGVLGPIEGWVDADLVVIDKVSGHLIALQVKRGGGKTDAGKRRQIERDLLAARSTALAYFAEHSPELGVRSCEVRIIDVYGNSGFDPGLTIRGNELDHAFGLPIEAWITATTTTLRAALLAILPELVAPVLAGLEPPVRKSERRQRSRAALIGRPATSMCGLRTSRPEKGEGGCAERPQQDLAHR